MRGAWVLALALLAPAACQTTQIVESQLALPEGDPVAGKLAFERLGCARCHVVAGADDLPEPTIDPEVPIALGGPRHSRPTDGRLVSAIINPSHRISDPFADADEVGTEGHSRMRDYGEEMTVKELVDIVAFLRSTER